ncbi:MAG: primosomal protein DnaI [Rhodobacteraceae bacterium CG17_big_fil_post_rev_8_21_14_2_50_63_15]|nr:DUF1127 domain-containing protein [Roseovarius sp.]PIV79527.1 MAG: primosomal protein DnaI [Rhodobacteraceae bacterium CG17_big_fil_post_rev_8_21_14_2_50_63_15]
MAVLDSTRTPASSTGFGGLFTRVFDSISVWNERRITRNALSQLSDRELDDIGLNRADISLVTRQF